MYARQKIVEAMIKAADTLEDEFGLGERDHDLMDLLVNLAAEFLDSPESSFDDAIRANYQTPPQEVRSWWTEWS